MATLSTSVSIITNGRTQLMVVLTDKMALKKMPSSSILPFELCKRWVR